MIAHEIGQQLHDKATRGMALTDEERTTLERWYADLDREEQKAIAQEATPERLSELRAQVQSTTVAIGAVTERIQKMMAENDSVRNEIAQLQKQLAHRSQVKTA